MKKIDANVTTGITTTRPTAARHKVSLVSKTARERLAVRREPYWHRLSTGLYLGYRVVAVGDGTWVARRRNENGKQNYRALGSFADFDQAARVAREWAQSLDAGVNAGRITVATACLEYIQHLILHKGERAACDARQRLKRLVISQPIGRIRLDRLRIADVSAWQAAQIEGVGDQEKLRCAKERCNRNFHGFKAALSLALKNRLVASDAGWKTVVEFSGASRRRQGFLTPEGRVALLAALDADREDLARFVRGLLLTGARPGELAGTTVASLDTVQGTLSLSGKTGRRVIPLSAAALAVLTAAGRDRNATAPLFATVRNHAWRKELWNAPFRRAVKAAQLPSGTVMYGLRHTEISELIAGGLDVFSVARLTGTSSAMIDKHYGHLVQNRTRSLLDAIAIL